MTHTLYQTIAQIQPLDVVAMQQARDRQALLTKPRGSLGQLEDLSVALAAITGQTRPRFRQPVLIVAAADHGITQQGVSAYPSSVTAQMVANFLAGGAAINVLARQIGARVVVADVGVAAELAPHPELVARKIAPGTRDFAVEPAMTEDQAVRALETGIELAHAEIARGADIIGTGDMGIGNTTASAAITAVITDQPVLAVTGRGTGVDDAGLAHKISVIERALALHTPDRTNGLEVLRCVGGFEIGALAGVILGAAIRRVPVVIDGFIAGAAALIAVTLMPAVQPYMIAAHLSVERGHRAVLEHLHLRPLLDLGLRLGEGSGAALGISLCMTASALLDEMATFGEAGVDEKLPDERGDSNQ